MRRSAPNLTPLIFPIFLLIFLILSLAKIEVWLKQAVLYTCYVNRRDWLYVEFSTIGNTERKASFRNPPCVERGYHVKASRRN